MIILALLSVVVATKGAIYFPPAPPRADHWPLGQVEAGVEPPVERVNIQTTTRLDGLVEKTTPGSESQEGQKLDVMMCRIEEHQLQRLAQRSCPRGPTIVPAWAEELSKNITGQQAEILKRQGAKIKVELPAWLQGEVAKGKRCRPRMNVTAVEKLAWEMAQVQANMTEQGGNVLEGLQKMSEEARVRGSRQGAAHQDLEDHVKRVSGRVGKMALYLQENLTTIVDRIAELADQVGGGCQPVVVTRDLPVPTQLVLTPEQVDQMITQLEGHWAEHRGQAVETGEELEPELEKTEEAESGGRTPTTPGGESPGVPSTWQKAMAGVASLSVLLMALVVVLACLYRSAKRELRGYKRRARQEGSMGMMLRAMVQREAELKAGQAPGKQQGEKEEGPRKGADRVLAVAESNMSKACQGGGTGVSQPTAAGTQASSIMKLEDTVTVEKEAKRLGVKPKFRFSDLLRKEVENDKREKEVAQQNDDKEKKGSKGNTELPEKRSKDFTKGVAELRPVDITHGKSGKTEAKKKRWPLRFSREDAKEKWLWTDEHL